MDFSSTMSPIIVRIETKSYAITLLPEAPVQVHLYVNTCT